MPVHPDGEFAIIAGMIIKKAIAVAKVAKVAKVAGATAKAAASVGTQAGTTVAKGGKLAAFWAKQGAQIKSGTLNAASNYNFDNGWDDFGLGTVLDFAAGWGGAQFGVSTGLKYQGVLAGGTLNWAVNYNDDNSGYKNWQNFVGGSLSVYAGMGKALKTKTLFDKSGTGKGLLKRQKSNWFAKTGHKYGDSFIKYGLQANAYDFAYTKQEDYVDRTLGQHLGIFATGGAFGAATQNYFTDNKVWRNKFWPDMARSGLGFVGFAGEYTMSGFIKKRFNGFKDDPTKIGIFSGKWFEQTIVNFGTRP